MDIRKYLTDRMKSNNISLDEVERAEQYYFYYGLIFDKWKDIATNMFIWENLPEPLDSRTLETMLFEKGVLGFADGTVGKVILPLGKNAKLNVYNKPEEITLFGKGYNETFKKDDFVIIRSSNTERPLIDFIGAYCYKLTDIDFTIRTQLNAHKMPLIIKGDKNTKNTLNAYYKGVSSFKPAITVDAEKMSENPIDFTNTQVNYISDKLFDLFKAYEAEILTHLGINNNPMEKKERMITNEVDANNEVINYHLAVMLKPRMDAVEAINKRFNTNIKVKINYDFIERVIEPEEKEEEQFNGSNEEVADNEED